MADSEICVIGAGLAGLAVALHLAGTGRGVTCYGDSKAGASLSNFGQLHSGAVYAPVLPEIATDCWEHRTRWFPYLDSPGRFPGGLGLFAEQEQADRYVRAWRDLNIPVVGIDPRDTGSAIGTPNPHPAAAFRLPDVTADTALLHQRLAAHAASVGVRLVAPAECQLTRDDTVVIAFAGGERLASRLIVLCAGTGTVPALDQAGLRHPLALSYLPYGFVPSRIDAPLAYWLDDDMLAISPAPGGVSAALPGRSPDKTGTEPERSRLAESVSRHWPSLAWERLTSRRGIAAEPRGDQADPSAQVIDLRVSGPTWDEADNLIVCLPGKWTTAWKAADQVLAAVEGRA